MSNQAIIESVINPDEDFIWEVTGSVADVKYNPIYLLLTVITLGIFLFALHLYRIYRTYVLTNQRLIIITGILSKQVDEIELFRVVDSRTEQSIIDRMANLGSITVNSTDRTGIAYMKKIPQPYYVRDSLRQAYTIARQKKGTVVLENLQM